MRSYECTLIPAGVAPKNPALIFRKVVFWFEASSQAMAFRKAKALCRKLGLDYETTAITVVSIL